MSQQYRYVLISFDEKLNEKMFAIARYRSDVIFETNPSIRFVLIKTITGVLFLFTTQLRHHQPLVS